MYVSVLFHGFFSYSRTSCDEDLIN